MAKRILILGTSNSLITGGWVDGLKASNESFQIHNKSIGASPGIQFAAHIDTDFSVYDYVFFDSVPNDEQYQYESSGYSELEFIVEVLRDIFSVIASHTRLIVLGVCNKNYFDVESKVYSARRALAGFCNSEFIDVRKILRSCDSFFVARSGVRDLYDAHPSHPLPQHMKLIGYLIGKELNDSVKGAIRPSIKTPGYSTWIAADNNDQTFSVIEKENSFLQEKFGLIYDGVQLNFPEEKLCLGFYINFHGTDASVRVENSFAGKVRSISLFNKTSDKLLKLFVPIPNGERSLRLTVQGKCPSDCYTPVVFSKRLFKSDRPILHISHAVFRDSGSETIGCLEDFISKFSSRESVMTESIISQVMQLQKKFPGASEPGITDSRGRNIFYSLSQNKCVAIFYSVFPENHSDLYPVFIRERDHEVCLFVSIQKSDFLLSAYLNSVSIAASAILKIKHPVGAKIGVDALTVSHGDRGFSLLYGDMYVSALPDGRLVVNRKEAKAWEVFSFKV